MIHGQKAALSPAQTDFYVKQQFEGCRPELETR